MGGKGVGQGWFYGDGISGAWRAEHVTNVRFWETVQYLYNIDKIVKELF